MNTFRWGIIGCGGIATRFGKVVNKLENMEISAVAARDTEKAKAFADEYDAKSYYGSYDEMLGSGKIDAVYISTVNSAHYDCMKLAIEHKIPILCEKPMLLTLAEFDEIMSLAKQNNVPVMEAMWATFLPSVKKIKELMDGGAIGDTSIVQVNFMVPFEYDESSRIYDKSVGGGLTYDIGVYNLHMLFSIMGDDYSNLSFSGQRVATGVDENVAISMTFGDRIVATATTARSFSSVQTALYGDKGRIILDNFATNSKVELVTESGSQWFDCPVKIDGFEYQICEFARVVNAGELESSTVSHARSRKVCEIMEKVYKEI